MQAVCSSETSVDFHYMALYLRRQNSSQPPLWELQIRKICFFKAIIKELKPTNLKCLKSYRKDGVNLKKFQFVNRPLQNYAKCSGKVCASCYTVVMCIPLITVTCRGHAWLIDVFWIGWLDLLTLYTLHSELQAITALLLFPHFTGHCYTH
jgi:hypothetical protein